MIPGPKKTLILQRNVGTTTIHGQSDDWGDYKRITGVLATASGSKGIYYDRHGIQATHTFYMDYPRGFMPTEYDRIRYGTRYFMITFVDNADNRNTHLELALQEGVGKNR